MSIQFIYWKEEKMKKIPFEHLDLTIYEETLENGLQVYIVPKENCNNARATLVTKYGSNVSEFVPIGKTEMIRVPDGVAHFLEHKLFEQEDGVDPFSFFDESGSECNASTNPWQTNYWFSGTQDFEKNLTFLLDFVQAPYFTKKNVEKEKGIIVQEIEMYMDDPYRVGFEKSNLNLLQVHPLRISTGGTKESVESITEEDLYTCYETFYHPSNMALVITGNVNPETTMELVRQNQGRKQFPKPEPIQIRAYQEPDFVNKEYESIAMNVTIPKIFINYKLNKKEMMDIPETLLPLYISIYLDIKLSSTSTFLEQLKKDKIVTDDVYFDFSDIESHILLSIEGETEKQDELISCIDLELKNTKTTEVDFIRKKKTILSSCIFMSDSVDLLNNRLVSDFVRYGHVRSDLYDEYQSLNYSDFRKVVDAFHFDHRSVLVIHSKDV